MKKKSNNKNMNFNSYIQPLLYKIKDCKLFTFPYPYAEKEDLLPEEMNSLYNHPKIKAHVSFTKGEGFGRPLLEASLSGKPVKERSTEVIRYLKEHAKKDFPIIAVGGVHSKADYEEKLAAGASLVQVYTGFIYQGPALVKQIPK